MEASTGAEIYVYTQVDPGISEDENLANAAALMDQWGIGRSGFDDGLVLMVGAQPGPAATAKSASSAAPASSASTSTRTS